jgi:hypothetical protein
MLSRPWYDVVLKESLIEGQTDSLSLHMIEGHHEIADAQVRCVLRKVRSPTLSHATRYLKHSPFMQKELALWEV